METHGGTVTQLLGDGVKAVFGAPRVAEDDALRAVRAAVEMQRAFRALASEESGAVGEVGLRVAVNTGEGVAKDESEIIASVAVLWELAPEMQWNPAFTIALDRHGWVGVMETSGTLPEGGAFERPFVYVATGAGGRIGRIEMFEIEAADPRSRASRSCAPTP